MILCYGINIIHMITFVLRRMNILRISSNKR